MGQKQESGENELGVGCWTSNSLGLFPCSPSLFMLYPRGEHFRTITSVSCSGVSSEAETSKASRGDCVDKDKQALVQLQTERTLSKWTSFTSMLQSSLEWKKHCLITFQSDKSSQVIYYLVSQVIYFLLFITLVKVCGR